MPNTEPVTEKTIQRGYGVDLLAGRLKRVFQPAISQFWSMCRGGIRRCAAVVQNHVTRTPVAVTWLTDRADIHKSFAAIKRNFVSKIAGAMELV